MSTKRYAISLSLALALGVSTGTQASQANHESEWSNVISYGDTTIAQDSPNDFGSWKMMVQPSAGPRPMTARPITTALPTPSQTSSPRPNINPLALNNQKQETGGYRFVNSTGNSTSLNQIQSGISSDQPSLIKTVGGATVTCGKRSGC